jgi:hypothetical protein
LDIFDDLRTENDDGKRQLSATAMSAAVHVATLASGTTPTPPGTTPPGTTPPGTTPPGTTDDVSMVAYIDALRMMDDFEMFVMGEDTSDDAEDYDTSMLTSTADPEDASYGDDIYTHMSAATGEFGGKDAANAGIVDIHWAEWGVWGVLKEGTIGGSDVMTKAFAGGVEADAPMGSKGGSAVWTGTFVGHHQVAWTSSTASNSIAMGDLVDGRAQLTVSFTDKGLGNTMDAKFDKFYSQGAPNGATRTSDESIAITGIEINKNGSFDHAVAAPADFDTDAEKAQAMAVGSMVEGQFVGMDGMGAIGAMTLINEGDGSSAADLGTDNAEIDAAGEFVIIGSFGAGRNQ